MHVAEIFERVLKRFTYLADPKGEDWFISAEDMLEGERSYGDCEDLAGLIAALLQAFPNAWNCRIIIAVHETEGHAFTEVKIGRDKIEAQLRMERLAGRWKCEPDQLPIVTDDDGSVWLTLDGGPPPKAFIGDRHVAVFPDGSAVNLQGLPRIEFVFSDDNGPPIGHSRHFPASRVLAEYARQLSDVARPGQRSRDFVGSHSDEAVRHLALMYETVIRQWKNLPDPEGAADWLVSAEDLLASNSPAGDKEDFAGLMVALLQSFSNPWPCRIVFGTNEGKSHSFAEVKIGRDSAAADHALTLLAKRWNCDSSKLATTSDADGSIWLALDGGTPPSRFTGKRDLVILPDGSWLDYRPLTPGPSRPREGGARVGNFAGQGSFYSRHVQGNIWEKPQNAPLPAK